MSTPHRTLTEHGRQAERRRVGSASLLDTPPCPLFSLSPSPTPPCPLFSVSPLPTPRCPLFSVSPLLTPPCPLFSPSHYPPHDVRCSPSLTATHPTMSAVLGLTATHPTVSAVLGLTATHPTMSAVLARQSPEQRTRWCVSRLLRTRSRHHTACRQTPGGEVTTTPFGREVIHHRVRKGRHHHRSGGEVTHHRVRKGGHHHRVITPSASREASSRQFRHCRR